MGSFGLGGFVTLKSDGLRLDLLLTRPDARQGGKTPSLTLGDLEI